MSQAIELFMEFFAYFQRNQGSKISTKCAYQNTKIKTESLFVHFVRLWCVVHLELPPNGEINDKWKWHLFENVSIAISNFYCLVIPKQIPLGMVHWPFRHFYTTRNRTRGYTMLKLTFIVTNSSSSEIELRKHLRLMRDVFSRFVILHLNS